MIRSLRRHRRVALAAAAAALIPSAFAGLASATPPTLTAVTRSGDQFELSEPAFIIGHDRGQSVGYSSGSTNVSVWSFGDTETWNGGWASNTVGTTTDLSMSGNVGSWTYDNMSTSGTNRPGDAVALPAPYPARNTALNCTTCYRNWAGMMAADPANHRIVMLYHIIGRVTKDGKDVDKGYGVAVRDMDDPNPTFEPMPISNEPLATNPYLLWYNPNGNPPDATHPLDYAGYASGFTKHGSYFYAYSCNGPFGGTCTVGRVGAVNPGSVFNRNSWRFWDGTTGTWSADVADATELESGDPGGKLSGGFGGMSVFWNLAIDKFVQVYSVGADIRYRVADAPEGPWSRSDLIAQGKAGTEVYAAYAHPEYAENGGADQYLTYYRSYPGGDPEFRVVKATFAATGASYARSASVESYFAHDSTVRINTLGPTGIDSATTDSTSVAASHDRHGTVYQPGGGTVGASAVVKLEAQTSGTTQSIAGLVLRNSLGGGDQDGYVVLAKRGSAAGGIVLRADLDGDGDLDAGSGAAPVSATGPVWLKLTRSTATTYLGSYSTDSTNGTDGTWSTPWSVTVPSASTVQDAGMFAAGPNDGSTFNKGTFSGFALL